MHKKMPATTWLAWVHVFNYFTCLLDRGASAMQGVFVIYIKFTEWNCARIENINQMVYSVIS